MNRLAGAASAYLASAAHQPVHWHPWGDEAHYAEAEAALCAFAGGAAELGIFAATYCRALDAFLNGMTTIVVAKTTTIDLSTTALETYRPRKVVARAGPGDSHHLSPPFALRCSGMTCSAPARTAPDLRAAMDSLGRTG